MSINPTAHLREALEQIASCHSHSAGDVVDIARKALALTPSQDSGGSGERVTPAPVDDDFTRAFIDGWNARFDHDDFDMALHYWMLSHATLMPPPTLAPQGGSGELLRVCEECGDTSPLAECGTCGRNTPDTGGEHIAGAGE